MLNEIYSTENITKEQFNEFLDQYDDLITSLTFPKSENAKAGHKDLKELDEWRFKDAVDAFSSSQPKRQMTHDDVKELVFWKLRHGKFRPSLMKQVSSNDSAMVQETISNAMAEYWRTKNVMTTLDAITKPIKGIGPATASLIISVHDPDETIFFSDEAFWWLCREGKQKPIKYTAKEYQELCEAFRALRKRLGDDVNAVQVEKVAYAMLKKGPPSAQPMVLVASGDPLPPVKVLKGPFSEKAQASARVAENKASMIKPGVKPPGAARKSPGTKRNPKKEVEANEDLAGVRRSKRVKTSST